MSKPVIGRRLYRSFVQSIDARPKDVFPLLCPVREAEWLPHWTYEMIHSVSGIAEPGAVFTTPHTKGSTVWLTVTHDRPSHVRYVRWQPDRVVVDIDIRIDPAGGDRSDVRIAYSWLAVDREGMPALDEMTDEAWHAMMTTWQAAMNRWFAGRRFGP